MLRMRSALNLHAVCASSSKEDLIYLLDNGADLEQLNGQGHTALMVAAQLGNDTAIRLLLDSGALVDRRTTYDHRTALQLACLAGNALSLRWLLARGASYNLGDINGMTALHCAALSGSVACAQQLLQSGANINAATLKGKTPLFCAVRNNHVPLIAMLRALGADCDQQNSRGETALMYARRLRLKDCENALRGTAASKGPSKVIGGRNAVPRFTTASTIAPSYSAVSVLTPIPDAAVPSAGAAPTTALAAVSTTLTRRDSVSDGLLAFVRDGDVDAVRRLATVSDVWAQLNTAESLSRLRKIATAGSERVLIAVSVLLLAKIPVGVLLRGTDILDVIVTCLRHDSKVVVGNTVDALAQCLADSKAAAALQRQEIISALNGVLLSAEDNIVRQTVECVRLLASRQSALSLLQAENIAETLHTVATIWPDAIAADARQLALQLNAGLIVQDSPVKQQRRRSVVIHEPEVTAPAPPKGRRGSKSSPPPQKPSPAATTSVPVVRDRWQKSPERPARALSPQRVSPVTAVSPPLPSSAAPGAAVVPITASAPEPVALKRVSQQDLQAKYRSLRDSVNELLSGKAIPPPAAAAVQKRGSSERVGATSAATTPAVASAAKRQLNLKSAMRKSSSVDSLTASSPPPRPASQELMDIDIGLLSAAVQQRTYTARVRVLVPVSGRKEPGVVTVSPQSCIVIKQNLLKPPTTMLCCALATVQFTPIAGRRRAFYLVTGDQKLYCSCLNRTLLQHVFERFRQLPVSALQNRTDLSLEALQSIYGTAMPLPESPSERFDAPDPEMEALNLAPGGEVSLQPVQPLTPTQLSELRVMLAASLLQSPLSRLASGTTAPTSEPHETESPVPPDERVQQPKFAPRESYRPPQQQQQQQRQEPRKEQTFEEAQRRYEQEQYEREYQQHQHLYADSVDQSANSGYDGQSVSSHETHETERSVTPQPPLPPPPLQPPQRRAVSQPRTTAAIDDIYLAPQLRQPPRNAVRQPTVPKPIEPMARSKGRSRSPPLVSGRRAAPVVPKPLPCKPVPVPSVQVHHLAQQSRSASAQQQSKTPQLMAHLERALLKAQQDVVGLQNQVAANPRSMAFQARLKKANAELKMLEQQRELLLQAGDQLGGKRYKWSIVRPAS